MILQQVHLQKTLKSYFLYKKTYVIFLAQELNLEWVWDFKEDWKCPATENKRNPGGALDL